MKSYTCIIKSEDIQFAVMPTRQIDCRKYPWSNFVKLERHVHNVLLIIIYDVGPACVNIDAQLCNNFIKKTLVFPSDV